MAKCRELLNKGLLQDISREQMWALSEVREKDYYFQKLPLDKSHFITGCIVELYQFHCNNEHRNNEIDTMRNCGNA